LVERVRLAAERDRPPRPVTARCERLVSHLRQELQGAGPAELQSFQDHLMVAVAEAYTGRLYAASYLVNGGGSLDGFYYFRAWLVFQGRETHRQAITDPDSLADICTDRGVVADYECEGVLNVAKRLYRERTGQDLSWQSDPGDLGQPMPGERWADEELPLLLPRLYRIHSEAGALGGASEAEPDAAPDPAA
jgi:hypothetical protein